MKTGVVTICLVVGSLLGCAAGVDKDPNTGVPPPVVFVIGSPIIAAVKESLATANITGIALVHVEVDKDGVVRLTGSVRTQEVADEVASVARETEHVTAVYNDLRINKSGRSG